MRVLLVHHRLPWPLNNGMDKLRYNLIRTLSKSYKITLAVPFMGAVDNAGADEIRKYVKDLIMVRVHDLRKENFQFFFKRIISLLFLQRPYYISDCYSKTFDICLKLIVEDGKFDYVHFLSDFSGQYLLSQSKRQKLILGPLDDNVQTYYEDYLDSKNVKDKVVSYINVFLIKRFFKKILTKANLVYFHSDADLKRATLRLKTPVNATTLPVATELEDGEVDNHYEENNSIVFVGGMGASFNQDAVNFFVKSVFPAIKIQIPDIRFYIVGNDPPMQIMNMHTGESIIVTGAVESVDPYIKKAKVYVSPIQKGTGIKTKMIEALKAGKAIVATNKALQGLWEVNKEAIRIEDDPYEFAKAVVEILKNDSLRVQMETKAKELYEEYYKFEKVVPLTLNIHSKSISNTVF